MNPKIAPTLTLHPSASNLAEPTLLKRLKRFGRELARLELHYQNLKRDFVHLAGQPPVDLQIRTLGELTIHCGEHPVNPPFQRCSELMVYLALNGPSSREQIIDALWDGSRTPSHREYFRVVVRRTRAALRESARLGFNPIEYHDKRYRLAAPFQVNCDALTLEAALQHQNASKLQGALNLYGGDFLPGFNSEWIALRRTALLDAALELGLRLGESLEARQPRAALRVYQHLLRLDPLLAGGHEALARLGARLGERAVAQVVRSARRRMKLELGLSKDTR